MTFQGRFSWRRMAPTALLAATLVLAFSPLGTSFSSGITTEDAGFDPTHGGCTSCHGGGSFADQGAAVSVVFMDEAGEVLSGPYEHGAQYTITITLDEVNAPGADNHAGFNFFIDAGTLESADGDTKVTSAGDEAAHSNPTNTQWSLLWTAPDEGTATWRLFVNDVDGSRNADEPDQVYLTGGWVSDEEYAMPGAVEEEEVHVGVPLPQYWLGLLAIGMMVFVILFGFVYLKYVSPHNTDQKDR